MEYKELQDYLENRMKMQHIYQPVMIKTLLESKNTATVEAIARAFLQDDMSQIDYYKQITKNMPGKVLRKNKVVTYQDDKFILNAPNFTDEQRKKLIKICNEKVKKYQEKFGNKIWIHRARSSRVIPGSMRYIVLKNAKNRCELCGIHKDEKALDVDHIVPINKGGPNVIENMQALCYTCNSQKGDRDSTDFRLWQGMYEKKEKKCIFCNSDKVEIENLLAFTIKDGFPVTILHYLIIPKRHVSSFFELGSSEHKACLNLLEETKRKVLEKDKTVTGFNVGINIGRDAGQTVMHCHIHLIPRRSGDVAEPQGGIRNIIPGKGKY